MNIDQIKSDFIKVAEIVKNNGKSKKLLKCDWVVDKEIRTKNHSRIYIITSNNVIMKIGGSESKGGIQSTISFYESANTGKPSIRSFAVQKMIIREIENGNKVELHVRFLETIKVMVEGLMDKIEMEVPISFKDSEKACIEDYHSITGKFPEWNKQENHEKWPEEIEKEYIKYRSRSGK